MPFVLDIPNFILVPFFPGTYDRLEVRIAPNLSLRHGTVLGEYAALKGVFGPYDATANDGRNLARMLLQFDIATDSNGNITMASLVSGQGPKADRFYERVHAFISGSFACEDLIGLDQQAARQLGRIIAGNVSQGVLRVG